MTAATARSVPPDIALLISDVDGTLVTRDKRLAPRTVDAVLALAQARIAFAVTSSRPPVGLRMLIEPLRLVTPICGFNGGLIVDPGNFAEIEGYALPADVAQESVAFFADKGVDVWLFNGPDWLLRHAGPYVDLEQRTIAHAPKVVDRFDVPGLIDRAYKIVGVSADFDLLARCESELRERLGEAATVARSQAYYLDVTHPQANKGRVVHVLSRRLSVPLAAIATVGDGRNDVAMFGESAFAIAMGNAAPAVKQAADRITSSNEEDGFAHAVERFILPHGENRPGRATRATAGS